MKKISTTTTKKDEKVASQKLTIGLDLGDRWSWYCVLNEAGEVVLEQKVATTPKAMKEVFSGMPRSRLELETGTHSPWVSRVLSEVGHEVIVAHARNVRLIGESRKKDDRLDARTCCGVGGPAVVAVAAAVQTGPGPYDLRVASCRLAAVAAAAAAVGPRAPGRA